MMEIAGVAVRVGAATGVGVGISTWSDVAVATGVMMIGTVVVLALTGCRDAIGVGDAVAIEVTCGPGDAGCAEPIATADGVLPTVLRAVGVAASDSVQPNAVSDTSRTQDMRMPILNM